MLRWPKVLPEHSSSLHWSSSLSFCSFSNSGVYYDVLKLSVSDVIVCKKGCNGDRKLQFFGRDYLLCESGRFTNSEQQRKSCCVRGGHPKLTISCIRKGRSIFMAIGNTRLLKMVGKGKRHEFDSQVVQRPKIYVPSPL